MDDKVQIIRLGQLLIGIEEAEACSHSSQCNECCLVDLRLLYLALRLAAMCRKK